MKLLKKAVRALLTEAGRELKDYYTSAIIVAAGKSTRMNGTVPKQLVYLRGIPVAIRSVLAFEKCPLIDEIIVVAAKGEEAEYKKFKREYGLKKLTNIVTGGATRAESVLSGFEAVSEKCEFVAIHDGARCLIKTSDIERVIKAAYGCGAAIAAAKSTDTLKRVNEKGIIESTVDRDCILRAQTPQVFMKEIYAASVYSPRDDDAKITDDSMLAESKGFKVKAVDVGAYNLKITTGEDIFLAERIIDCGSLCL